MSLVSSYYDDVSEGINPTSKPQNKSILSRPLKRQRNNDTKNGAVKFTLPIQKMLKSVNTEICEDEPIAKKYRFDHYDSVKENLKDLLPAPKNSVMVADDVLEDADDLENDENLEIIPKDSKLESSIESHMKNVDTEIVMNMHAKGKTSLVDSLVEESLKDILAGVPAADGGKGSVKVKVGDVKVENKVMPVRRDMVGPKIPLEIRKKQNEKEVIKNTNYEENNNDVSEVNSDNVWNPDFVREWERANPGNKFEQVEYSGEANIINVNAYQLRIDNWEAFNHHQQQKNSFQKGIVSNRKSPITKGARKNGHISALLRSADTQEHELYEELNSGKNKRDKTKNKYGW
jgi:hypothetical protein